MKNYRETVVEEIQHSDLDLQEPFYTGEERNEVDTAEDIWSETVSMDIDEALKTLTTLKEKGSNRVYLYAHSDHNGYIFTGVKLEEVADE